MTGRRPLDPLALDRMVLGTDDERDLDVWTDLLATPRAADAWREAVERRRRIDAVARAIAAAPWLAGPMLRLRRAMRRSVAGSWPGATVTMSSPLAAMLAPEVPHDVPLTSGATTVIDVPVGAEVRIERPLGTRLYRLTSGGEVAFDHPGWRMERGDGVVAIVARNDEGAPLATLALIESPSGENAP